MSFGFCSSFPSVMPYNPIHDLNFWQVSLTEQMSGESDKGDDDFSSKVC
jgi:hypothetical protein